MDYFSKSEQKNVSGCVARVTPVQPLKTLLSRPQPVSKRYRWQEQPLRAHTA
jgi:hypothetical protein